MSEYQKLRVKFHSMKKSCVNAAKWFNFYVKVTETLRWASKERWADYKKISDLTTEVEIIRARLRYP